MSESHAIVIVPTYNERDNLPTLAERVLNQSIAIDMLVVDDGSPDGTGEIADALAKKHPSIHVLHRARKNGLGRAYCDGFRWALERDYEFIFEMDGDFSHNPDDLPKFLEAMEGKDLVLGSRYQNGIRVINWPLNRLLLSLCAAQYVKIITGMPITDPTGGFKCFRRRALQAIDLDQVQSNGYSFQIELTHKLWRQGMQISGCVSLGVGTAWAFTYRSLANTTWAFARMNLFDAKLFAALGNLNQPCLRQPA